MAKPSARSEYLVAGVVFWPLGPQTTSHSAARLSKVGRDQGPGLVSGQSLLPILRARKSARDPVFSERRTFEELPKPYLAGNEYSLIDGEWHLIVSTFKDRPIELYNLTDDPGETSNIGDQNSIVQTLSRKLEHRRKQLKALHGTTPVTDPDMVQWLRSIGYVP